MLLIRRFRQEDLRSLMTVEEQSFGPERWPRDLLQWYAGQQGSIFLVAQRSGRIAGYCVGMVRGDAATIDSLAVRPSAREQGIGTALVSGMVRRLRRLTVRSITLMVRRSNEAAIRLYRRFGFRRVATIAHYYENGATAWRMRRSLQNS